jgi:hypothetical protein
MMIFKVKRVQQFKELKIEMYKLIRGLMFKCNRSGRQFNSILTKVAIKEIRENKIKDQIKT